jgi:hypothetical protein
MALITPGGLVGQISGKAGTHVFSRNRGGAYMRNHVVPITSTTADALAAKARLSNLSTAWGALTAAQRLAWEAWAQTNPAVNRLGNQITLQGNAAFIQVNTRMLRAGLAQLSDPPLGVAPDALTTLSGTYDIGAGTFTIIYTPTPLGATERFWMRTYVASSEGVNFVENLLRVTTISPAAQGSGADDQADIEAKFGALSVGQVVHRVCHVFDGATGLLSAPLRTRGTVVST